MARGAAIRQPQMEITVNTIALILLHVACIAAIWTGVHWHDLALMVVLYAVRMFGVTAGYHRYFSHRTYKMGRVSQFLMAFLAMSSAQKGIIWWAWHHRHHHRYSDTAEDVHSPRQQGFFWSHIGWIISNRWRAFEPEKVKDLMRFPELRFLQKYELLPPVLLGLATLLLFGWSGLVVGFVWSTVLLYHGTFTINSLAHVIGKRRYETSDDSRNNWFLALITLGEGWHNNHHRYQSSTRQGFYWWEIDLSYYGLKLLEKLRLVWDLREPPAHLFDSNDPRSLQIGAPKADDLALPDCKPEAV